MRYIVDDLAFTITPLDAPVTGGTNDEGARDASWFSAENFDRLSRWWTLASWERKNSYQFRWLGRPIIQLPADVMMVQDVLWRTKPDVIVETGIAHGGSVVLHASLLRLIHGDARLADRRPQVLAVDVDIRAENRAALEAHSLRPFYTLIEGSSIDAQTVERVRAEIRPADRVCVILDSNHTMAHVRDELRSYARMVTPGGALIVMDGIMRDLASLPGGTPSWANDNPSAAVEHFLATSEGKSFTRDDSYHGFALTHSPGGVLLRAENGTTDENR